MNPKDLTDEKLNEWVAERFEFKKVGGSYVVRINSQDMLMDAIIDECGEILSPAFDPCKNLNHTHLMEEKIREMKGVKSYPLNTYSPFVNYIGNLKRVLGVWDLFPDEEYKVELALISASARKRCEAAYLTLKELKSDK